MKSPTYYVAVFGDPNPPEKDEVESGRYHLGIRHGEIPGERGDIILLYCTGSYFEHFMTIPGVGIILTKTKDHIFYRYLPLSSPITKYDMDECFSDEDKNKLKNIRFSSFWMFDISKESFCSVIKNNPIVWP